MPTKFKSKSNVNDYLTDKINIEIYHELLNDERFKNCFECLDFFNLLYENYNFSRNNSSKPLFVKETLFTLDLTQEQLFCLIYFLHKKLQDKISTLLTRSTLRNPLTNLAFFLEQEIVKLSNELYTKEKVNSEEIKQIESENFTQENNQFFKLSNKKGTKTNLIRILNAMYELRMIEKVDGQVPTKSEFMEELGNVFGTNLTDYHSILSQSLKNQPLEVNLKVFEDLKQVIQEAHYTKE